MKARPAKVTTVCLFTKQNCPYCESFERVLVPVIKGIVSNGLAAFGVKIMMNPNGLQEHVKGYPSIVFLLDDRVVTRHTVDGFPIEHQTIEQFARWFGRFVVCVHLGEV